MYILTRHTVQTQFAFPLQMSGIIITFNISSQHPSFYNLPYLCILCANYYSYGLYIFCVFCIIDLLSVCIFFEDIFHVKINLPSLIKLSLVE